MVQNTKINSTLSGLFAKQSGNRAIEQWKCKHQRIWLLLLSIAIQLTMQKFLIAQTITVALSGTVRAMPDDIFGLNGTNTIVQGSSWGELQTANPHPFCKLQLGNIRYPGGQVSNWWNWKRGWFLNPPEYPAGITFHPAYDITNPFSLINGLDAFKANSDLLNANPIWSLNTLTSNKEYQTAFMFAARAKGFSVKILNLVLSII
nr:hypothetical protein [Bacteroidota bacterium]